MVCSLNDIHHYSLLLLLIPSCANAILTLRPYMRVAYSPVMYSCQGIVMWADASVHIALILFATCVCTCGRFMHIFIYKLLLILMVANIIVIEHSPQKRPRTTAGVHQCS